MSKLASDKGYNPFYEIDELPFTDDQKEMVLEWLAQKIWRTFDEEGHCKTYDQYMHGMYNGMEFCHALVKGVEPKYRKAPKQWLADIPFPKDAEPIQELAKQEEK